jgi:glycosyltransferase involved in cell wall biosynthesis
MPGIELVVTHTLTEELCDGIDILYFNRVISNQSINSVLDMRDRYGFKLVIDFDDHWNLGPDHYLYDVYQRSGASKIMEAYISECDAVTVTHERLYFEAVRHNKNTHILPNAIPNWGQFSVKKRPSEVTRLFWAGGITHVKDIELLRNPLKRFSNLPVKMVMGGYTSKPEYRRMSSAFTNGGKLSNLLIEALPVEDYYHAYAECDISLIPLTNTTFNSHKSNLKILEAANIGAPCVVSKVHPYLDIPFVSYVEKPGDWYAHVKYLLDNPERAKEQGENLKRYCDERFNFERINKQRRQLFESLCSKAILTSLKNTESITLAG